MIHYHKTQQNTDRIARTIVNVAVCRAFLRSILAGLPTASGPLPTASQIPTTYRPHGNLLFSRSFSWVMVAAVGAVDISSLSRWPIIVLRVSLCRSNTDAFG
jgi:hypothetical protein